MAGELKADSYSRVERLFVDPGRRLFMVLLGPLADGLVQLGITPNVVSGGQLVCGALFIGLVATRPLAASFVFLIALLLDALDGAMARRSGQASRFGALFDQFCDHGRETMVIAGLAAAGAISPLLAALYAFIYAAFNLTLCLCNYYRVALPIALKSYLVVYPAIFLFLWAGPNYLDWAVALGLFAMAVVIVQGLLRLQRAMDGNGA